MPCTRVEIICGTACFTVAAAPDALEESTPALVIQLWSLSTPAVASAEMLGALAGDAGDDDHDDDDGDRCDGDQDERRGERSAACGGRARGRAGIATTATMSAQTIGPTIV